jgi:hypothetical protein
MAYFGEDMDLDPYEDEFNINLGLFPDVFGAGRRALDSLPGILAGIYARGRELSSNAGGYEDDEDFIYRGPIYQTSDGTVQMQGPMHTTPVLLDQEVGGGGAPRRPTSTSSTSARPTTPTPSIYGIEGGGGGTRIITLPGGRTIPVPEGLNPLQLLVQGYITSEIYKQETGEDAPDVTQPNQTAEPVELVQETGDPLRRTTDPDPVNPVTPDPDPDPQAPINPQEPVDPVIPDPVDPVIPDPVDPTVPDPVDPVDPDPVISDPIDMSDPLDPVVTDPGDNTDPVDPGNNSNNGADSGNGDGTGGEGFDYEKFVEAFSKLYPAIPAGASFEEGTVPRIIPTALSYGSEVKDYARLIDAINREISPEQAETATNLYGQVTSAVRDAQSDEMQSLIRRSDMLGAEAESLMGPLSFLDRRDADQLGLGQAVAGGRGLGNVAPFLADRQRAERRDQNLQLAGDLLGQQRATNALMSDIESGIYSQIAPDIGVDPGQVLGITGMDIGNVLGERQGTRAAEAISRGAERQLYAQAMPYAGQAVQFGYDMIRNLLNRNKDSAGFPVNQDTRPMANVNPIV